jgi:hypothetical protein
MPHSSTLGYSLSHRPRPHRHSALFGLKGGGPLPGQLELALGAPAMPLGPQTPALALAIASWAFANRCSASTRSRLALSTFSSAHFVPQLMPSNVSVSARSFKLPGAQVQVKRSLEGAHLTNDLHRQLVSERTPPYRVAPPPACRHAFERACDRPRRRTWSPRIACERQRFSD